jgi:hypothetical protein
MEKFFKDKKRIFECTISVEGASINETSARLLLDFGNQTLMFRGQVTSDGRCTIEVPPIRNMNESNGKAILEVISESSLFEAWEAEFELKESKTVKVEMSAPRPIMESKPKIVANVIEEAKPKKKLTPIQESFTKELKYYKINESNLRQNADSLKKIVRAIKKKYTASEVQSLFENVRICFRAARS